MRPLLPLLILGLVFATVRCQKPSPPAPSVATATPLAQALADDFSGDRAHRHVTTVVGFGPRPPASEGFERTLAYLESELASVGWITTRQSFHASTPVGPVAFTNLIARYGGSESTPAAFVVGGHIDSKTFSFPFVGANDGGSSTGIMLELARVLSSDPASAAKVELTFFDGEEAFLPNITPSDGLYGSKYYAHDLATRPVRTAAGVVIDIVGDPDFPLFFNPDAPASFQKAVEEIGNTLGFNAGFRKAPGAVIDDHVPLQQIGLPCLHLIGDFTAMPYWHQPDDTLDKVHPEMLERVGKLVLRFLATPGLLGPSGATPGNPAD